MAGTEFDGLVEKIRAHGLRHRIKTWNGMLLDGRNRRRVCEAAGMIPQFEELELADEQQAIESSFRPIFIFIVTICSPWQNGEGWSQHDRENAKSCD